MHNQNIAMDIYILALPIGVILQLHMTLRRRLGVLAIIGAGLSSLIISCIRIPIVISLTKSPDTSYEIGKMIIVVALEIQFATVAVNLPSFTALASSKVQRAKKASLQKDGGHELFDRVSPKRGPSVSLGTVTRLERDMPRTESKEELCSTSADGTQLSKH